MEKIGSGWESCFSLSKGFKARPGQRDLWRIAAESAPRVMLAELCVGYGKTMAALGCYGILRAKGNVDRLLVLCATETQLNQWVAKWDSDARRLGMQVGGKDKIREKEHWCIRNARGGKVEMFAALYQNLYQQSSAQFWADFTGSGRFMVVADEAHHLGEEKAWGNAIQFLQYQHLLALTGTPIRGDGSKIACLPSEFYADGQIVPTVRRTYSNGVREGVNRKVDVQCDGYDIVAMLTSTGEKVELKTSELMASAEAKLDFDSYLAKRQLRLCDSYLGTVLLDAILLWQQRNAEQPGQHQVLVFAMSCKHAEQVSATLNRIAGDIGVTGKFADWIGDSEQFPPTSQRKERERAILNAYAPEDGKWTLPCLVNIDKCGEGFDNVRASILVPLHLIGTGPKLKQHIGRGLRRNAAVPLESDRCRAIVSKDSPALEMLLDLEAQGEARKPRSIEEATSEVEREQPLKIDDLVVVSATRSESHLKLYEGNTVEAQPDIVSSWAVRNSVIPAGMVPMLTAEAIEFLRGLMVQQGASTASTVQVAESDERRQILDQVTGLGRQIAGHILRRVASGKKDSEAKLNVWKKLNAEWKRASGIGHHEMTTDDLRRKHKWLQELGQWVNANPKAIPSWVYA